MQNFKLKKYVYNKRDSVILDETPITDNDADFETVALFYHTIEGQYLDKIIDVVRVRNVIPIVVYFPNRRLKYKFVENNNILYCSVNNGKYHPFTDLKLNKDLTCDAFVLEACRRVAKVAEPIQDVEI